MRMVQLHLASEIFGWGRERERERESVCNKLEKAPMSHLAYLLWLHDARDSHVGWYIEGN